MDEEIQEGRILAAIGYLGILCLLPLFLLRENEFARFHGKQGLVLFIAWILTWIAVSIIFWLFKGVFGYIPIIGLLFIGIAWIIKVIGIILYIFYLILMVMGIVQAAMGRYWRMPVLGVYAERLRF